MDHVGGRVYMLNLQGQFLSDYNFPTVVIMVMIMRLTSVVDPLFCFPDCGGVTPGLGDSTPQRAKPSIYVVALGQFNDLHEDRYTYSP